MSVCTFFGHRDCPDSLRPQLQEAVEKLIREAGADTFYVGNQGRFDAMALGVLRELERVYPISVMAWCWLICPRRRRSRRPCSPRDWRRCRPGTPLPGATNGCFAGRISLSPTSPTPGAVLPSMEKRRKSWGSVWSPWPPGQTGNSPVFSKFLQIFFRGPVDIARGKCYSRPNKCAQRVQLCAPRISSCILA